MSAGQKKADMGKKEDVIEIKNGKEVRCPHPVCTQLWDGRTGRKKLLCVGVFPPGTIIEFKCPRCKLFSKFQFI